jgi:hypothetical protein
MSVSRDKQRIREIRQRAAIPKLRPSEPSAPEENIQVSESQ